MKAAGDVLLIACYEMGHQPLAVAWPAAFLERAGYRPALLDLSVAPLDVEKVRRARLIAVSVPMHTALRLGALIAPRLRALNPRAHVCFYGLYATLNAAYLRETVGVDSILGGEIEDELVAVVRRLEAGAAPGPGTTTPALSRLDLPTPSRALLPGLDRYAHLERDGHRAVAGHVEASRGCKHRCRHCPIPPVYGGRFFVVPRDVVLADVRQQVAAGATHVTFGDPDFLNGPGHALAVARALHAEFPRLTFDVTAKIEHLLRHRDRLPELAALGCLFIVSAAESLSDEVLRHLDKGHTRRDIETALAATRAAGITLRPTWVAFTPWTTVDDYRTWLDFIGDEGLVDQVDAVQYAIRLLVPPGSLLLDLPALRPHLGPLVPEGFYHRWTHPDARMERLHEQVSAAVAAAAARAADATAVFNQVRALAAAAADAAPRPALAAAGRAAPPRLTEPWFC